MKATCIGYTPARDACLWRIEEPEELVLLTVDRELIGRAGGLTWTPSIQRAALRALGDAGLLVEVLRCPLLWASGRWCALERKEGAALLLADRLRVYAVDGEHNPEAWDYPNLTGDETLEEILEEARGPFEVPLPEKLASVLAGQHDRVGIPQRDGVLKHPVHGDCSRWLVEFEMSQLPKGAGPPYPHLRALFSAFGLPAHYHAALYVYLLASFHHWSLTYPRPILLVDSWIQGRGKSEVCQAIARLVDNEDSGVSLPGDADGARDEIISHFLTRRSLYVDNIDGVMDWNQKLLDTLATGDGAMRAKYSRRPDHVRGALVLLNTIYGTSTFHPDMVDRFLRVELAGEAQKLTPQPKFYAQEHRAAIIAEILDAHERAPAVSPEAVTHQSRFQHFEAAGAAAYSQVFGTPIEEVFELLGKARSTARAFLTPVARHLYQRHPARFLCPNERIFREIQGTPLNGRHEGAAALGLSLTKGEWQ